MYTWPCEIVETINRDTVSCPCTGIHLRISVRIIILIKCNALVNSHYIERSRYKSYEQNSNGRLDSTPLNFRFDAIDIVHMYTF